MCGGGCWKKYSGNRVNVQFTARKVSQPMTAKRAVKAVSEKPKKLSNYNLQLLARKERLSAKRVIVEPDSN